MPLLRQLINKFNEMGRHRMYRKLLRSVSHAGVRGLLVHDVKNEVEQALKVKYSTVEPPYKGHFRDNKRADSAISPYKEVVLFCKEKDDNGYS